MKYPSALFATVDVDELQVRTRCIRCDDVILNEISSKLRKKVE